MSGPQLKLDRSRTHATVHGEGEAHAFEQDGLPFNHHGDLVPHLVKEHLRPLVEKKLRKLARLQAPGDDPERTEPIVEAADDDEDDDGDGVEEINFEAWLKDEVRYQPQVVFREAKKRFSKVFTSYRQLAEFLVFEEQIVGPGDVPTKLKD